MDCNGPKHCSLASVRGSKVFGSVFAVGYFGMLFLFSIDWIWLFPSF